MNTHLHENCLNSNVKHFPEGNRIAKSTTIDVLMRSDFQISINDQKYDVTPPIACKNLNQRNYFLCVRCVC